MPKKSKNSNPHNNDIHGYKHTHSQRQRHRHSRSDNHIKKRFIPLVINNNRNISTSNIFDIENQIRKVPVTWNEYKKNHLSPTIKVDNSGYFPGGGTRKDKRTKRKSKKSKRKTKRNR